MKKEKAVIETAKSKLFCIMHANFYNYFVFVQSYERRGSVLKPGRESELWKNVTADMMSEEEEKGGSYNYTFIWF